MITRMKISPSMIRHAEDTLVGILVEGIDGKESRKNSPNMEST